MFALSSRGGAGATLAVCEKSEPKPPKPPKGDGPPRASYVPMPLLALPMSKPIPMDMPHSEPSEPLTSAALAGAAATAPPHALVGGAVFTAAGTVAAARAAKLNPGCVKPNPGAACVVGGTPRWFASGGRPAGTGGGPLGTGGTKPAPGDARDAAPSNDGASAFAAPPVPNANSGLGYALAPDAETPGITGALVPNEIPPPSARSPPLANIEPVPNWNDGAAGTATVAPTEGATTVACAANLGAGTDAPLAVTAVGFSAAGGAEAAAGAGARLPANAAANDPSTAAAAAAPDLAALA